MIVYFSGTGNSRYCAQFLAEQLSDEMLNAFDFIRNGIAAELYSDKPWVFVAPTYGWQLPHIFRDFLLSGQFLGNTDAYFVMTCGSEIGNSALLNQQLCHQKDLHYKGTLPVVMPENYIALFNAPTPEKALPIIQAAHPILQAGTRHILAGLDLPAVPAGMLDNLRSGPVNTLFYKLIVKSKAFTVLDDCIHCGKCVNACPMKNIQLKDGKPVWGDACTHCMACICGCPASAIEYGRISRGKPRYQCPEYQK